MKPAPDKRAVVEAYAAKGETMLAVDARQPGVVVPAQLQNDHQLLLKISHRYEGRDLVIDAFGVSITLSFSGVDFYCRIPWRAVVVAHCRVTGEIMGWEAPGDPPTITKRRGTLGLVN